MLLSSKKEHIWVSPNEVDEPRAYCRVEQVRKRDANTVYSCLCMDCSKMVLKHRLQGSSGDTDAENRKWAQRGREGVGECREQHGHTHTCNTDSHWESAAPHSELNPVLRDSWEGWDGMGDGRKLQDGGDICVPATASCWWAAETSTIL